MSEPFCDKSYFEPVPFTTVLYLTLKINLHPKGCFPTGNSESSQVPFFSRVWISSPIATLHSEFFRASCILFRISIFERLVTKA